MPAVYGKALEYRVMRESAVSSPSSSSAVSPKISLDGYIRLTFDAFSRLSFPQKLVWEDKSLREDLIESCIPAFRAGYCEWATDATPQVSLGWAWFGLADGQKFLAPGGISSNVMFVTQTNYDLGMPKTNELLCAWLARECWQPTEIAYAL
jgi:hypothetical protein